MDAAVIGFGLGFFVALQLGPMSLLSGPRSAAGGASGSQSDRALPR
jgi:hypothetical protein